MSKKSFYCWYLGFTEAYGLQGQNRVYEVIQNILKYHQNDRINKYKNEIENGINSFVSPSKVTLALNETGITIIDNTVVSQKKFFKKSNQQIVSKTYTISYENITYVCRLTNQPYSDIVTFITKSTMNLENNRSAPGDKLLLYLHAFRCDSDETAIKMERYFIQFLRVFWKKVEKQRSKSKKLSNEKYSRSNSPSETGHLFNSNLKNSFLNRQIFQNQGQPNRLVNYDNSSGGGTQSSSSNDLLNSTNESFNNVNRLPSPGFVTPVYNSSRPISPLNKPIEFDDINREIAYKLKSNQPILYPPKDYTREDRLRGNLQEAKFRRSQNPSIVGQEAYRQKNENLIKSKIRINDVIDETQTNISDFTTTSFNEQAKQVLKLLDDVVDSEISRPDYEFNSNIFEFKPPTVTSEFINDKKVLEPNVAYRSASFRSILSNSSNNRSSNYNNNNLRNQSQMSISMEDLYQTDNQKAKHSKSNNNLNQNIYGNSNKKSNSIASGLNDPYFDLNNQNGKIKTNPLHMIEEENFFNPVNNVNLRLTSSSRSNEYLNNNQSNTNYFNSSDQNQSNMMIFAQNRIVKSSISSNKNRNEHQRTQYSSDPANDSRVYPKMSNYHPQWLSNTTLNEISTNNSELINQRNNYMHQNYDTSYLQQTKQQMSNRNSEYNNNNSSNINKNIKLKYSESTKLNRDHNQDINGKLKQNSPNLNKGISFLKKGLTRVRENHVEYPNSENSEFILKPASYGSSSNEGKFLDVVPSSNLSSKYVKKSKMNNNSSYYRSEPALVNVPSQIKYNDIYY